MKERDKLPQTPLHSVDPARDEELRALGAEVAELAAEQAIPLDTDDALTGRLAQVVPAGEVPESVYGAVAALLGFLRDTEESASQ